MSSMMDARCPKCGCRIGWRGKAVDRPRCPKCLHQVDRAELEAADRQVEECRLQMLAQSNQLPKRLYTPAEIWRAKALQVEPEMLLPEGKTCADCRYWPTCRALIEYLDSSNQTCDFAPSRFVDSWRMREG